MNRVSFRLLLGAAVALGSSAALAGPSSSTGPETYVAMEPMAGKKLRVDGMLKEWPDGFAKLDAKLRGPGSRTTALVGYDDTNLYFAMTTDDAKIARSAGASQNEDHLTLEVFVPNPNGGGKTHTIEIYPGDPGKLPAVVKADGKVVASAQAVEAPQDKGYYLEAKLPWSAVPEMYKMRVGLRGRFVYTDATAPGSVKSVVASSKSSDQSAPPLTLEPETGLIQALLEPKQLGLVPERSAYGSVAGGPDIERVATYGHFVSIVGPGYRGGKQFYFNELDVANADGIRRLELRDFDGDGTQEIVLGKRIGGGDRYREVLEVLKIGSDGAPLRVFAHETAIKTDEGFIENEVKLTGSGKNARIEISQGKAEGFEVDTYKEPTVKGYAPPLLPWQTVGKQVYEWRGQGLALAEEKPWTPKPTSGSKKPSKAGPAAPPVKAPPPPRPPTADELMDRVYALYRKDRGVGGSKPTFDFVTDVAEDERPERVLVHGKDVVVFGKGFKEGLTYTFITVGVKDSKDILDVTARDLTGDGRAEIILRGVLQAQASKELGGDVVERDALYVYSVVGDSLKRIFAAETGRALGDNRIVGAVAFTPKQKGIEIELRPGRAIGWTEKSYPFPEDTAPAGGLEPLLLPWSSQKARTYTFKGTAFEQR